MLKRESIPQGRIVGFVAEFADVEGRSAVWNLLSKCFEARLVDAPRPQEATVRRLDEFQLVACPASIVPGTLWARVTWRFAVISTIIGTLPFLMRMAAKVGNEMARSDIDRAVHNVGPVSSIHSTCLLFKAYPSLFCLALGRGSDIDVH